MYVFAIEWCEFRFVAELNIKKSVYHYFEARTVSARFSLKTGHYLSPHTLLACCNMQPQPSQAEADTNVGLVMEIAQCTREAAIATLAAFGNDVSGAIAYLSSHDQQPPAASFSAAADLEGIAILEAHRRAGIPIDGSRLSGIPPHSRHGTLPAHILEHMARTGSPGPSDVAALMNGSSSLEAIIAFNDAVSRTRLERLLSEASQIQSNTSPIASLCCKYIRSIASSSTTVPIFEVNLILQFLAGSFSVRQQPSRDYQDDGDDDEMPVHRGLRSGSVGVPSRGSSADAILDPANGLPISVQDCLTLPDFLFVTFISGTS
jgi:hypothetical protein